MRNDLKPMYVQKPHVRISWRYQNERERYFLTQLPVVVSLTSSPIRLPGNQRIYVSSERSFEKR